jgi:predicted DNA binding protein
MLDFRIIKLQYTPPEVIKLGYELVFSKAKKVTILNTLMQNLDKFLFIVEIEWLDQPDNEFVKQHIFVKDSVELIIDENKSICLITGTFPKDYSDMLQELADKFNCFLDLPITLEENSITGNLVVSHKDLNKFLDIISSWGVEFNILSIKKYYPRGYGVISALTSQQLNCLNTAMENGYFDIPKRFNSHEIAKKLKITHTTFLEHIKKAEKTIFSNLLRI